VVKTTNGDIVVRVVLDSDVVRPALEEWRVRCSVPGTSDRTGPSGEVMAEGEYASLG